MNAKSVGEGHLPTDIERALRGTEYESQKYQQNQYIYGGKHDFDQLLKENPSMAEMPSSQRAMKSFDRALNSMTLFEETNRARVLGGVNAGIGKYFGGMNGQVQSGARTFGGMQQGLRTTQNLNPFQVERQLSASMNRMSGYEEQIRNISENDLVTSFGVEDVDARKRMTGLFGRAEREKDRQTRLTAARQIYKERGEDPASVYANVVTGEAKARSIGKGQKGFESAEKLISAFEKLSQMVDSTSKEYEEQLTITKEANKELKKATEGGGGGGPTQAQKLMAYGGMFAAAGGAAADVLVNQRIQAVGNRAGFAGWENQKYDRYKAGLSGDIESQMMLTHTADSEKFGTQIYAGQQAANAAYLASGVAQTAAGVAMTGHGAVEALNPIAEISGSASAAGTEALAGVQNTVGGIATSVSIASDVNGGIEALSAAGNVGIGGAIKTPGVTAGSAKLQAMQANDAATQAAIHVSAQQMQGYRDLLVGQSVAAQGMGAGGEAFINRTGSKANLTKMAAARMSPEQFNQMSQFGVDNIGSTFNESQIYSARNLEKSGYGSMQLNMQRQATLAQGGANNPTAALGSVLEASFSKSLEGSKVLNMMVENTAAMVQSSTLRQAGVDTTAASAQYLANNINTKDPNQEFAVQQAKSNAQLANEMGQNQSATFTGMVATARVSKTTGLSLDQAALTQNLKNEDLMSMKGMSDSDIKKQLTNMGVKVPTNSKASDIVSSLISDRKATVLTGKAGLAYGVDAEEINKAHSFSDLSESAQLKLGANATRSGVAGGGEALFRMGKAFDELQGSNPNASKKAGSALAGEAGGANQKELDNVRTAGMAQLSKAAAEAASTLGTTTQAVKALGDMIRNIEKQGNEKEFGSAASRAALSGESQKVFSHATDKFSTAVDKLIDGGGLGNRKDINPGKILDKMKDDFTKSGPK